MGDRRDEHTDTPEKSLLWIIYVYFEINFYKHFRGTKIRVSSMLGH